MGFLGSCLPLSFLRRETRLTALHHWLDKQVWYEHFLRIKQWKDRLPEAGGFFPRGISKNTLGGRRFADLQRFAAETRRAEYVHWAIWLFWIPTALWTPAWGVCLNLVFATLVNCPCLLIQRYNRLRIQQTRLFLQSRTGEC